MDKLWAHIGTVFNWWLQPFLVVFRAVAGVYPFKPLLMWCSGTSSSALHIAKYAAKRVVVCAFFFAIILWISVLLYASFYNLFVPSASILRPAHFKFRVCPSGSGMCTFPMANVTLGADNKAEILGRGLQYRVSLELRVPDSSGNRDVGMFMIHSRMYDRYGAITQQSSRAVTLKYQSDLLKLIQTVILAPLYITGFTDQQQTLNIELFDQFWDDYYHPTVGVLVELHSRQLVFYSAQLQLHAKYTGLRHYLFYYPLTCAFFGILFNCLWLLVVLVFTWYQIGLGLLDLGNKTDDNHHMPKKESIVGQGPDDDEDGVRHRICAARLNLEERDEEEVETIPNYCTQSFQMIYMKTPPPPPLPSPLPSPPLSRDTQDCPSRGDTLSVPSDK